MIGDAEISIVFQGPLVDERGVPGAFTQRAVKMARRIFPKAQIIVSTWEGGAQINLPGADEVVFSTPPDAISFGDDSGKLNNINRMILSTQRGLEMVKRPYALKLRTDCELHGSGVVGLWERWAREPGFARVFSRQVGAYPVYTMSFEERVGVNRMPKPFHVSDWCFFGRSDDVMRMFSHPQVEEPYFSRYFDYISEFDNIFDTLPRVRWQYSPEQYLTYSTFKRYFKDTPRFENKRHYTMENIGFSQKAIRENFLVLDQNQWNCSFHKEFYNKPLYLFDSNSYRGIRQNGRYVLSDPHFFLRKAPLSSIVSLLRNVANDVRHSAKEAGGLYSGVRRRLSPLSPLPPLAIDRQGATLLPGEELAAGKGLLSGGGNSVLEFDGLHIRVITKDRDGQDVHISSLSLTEYAHWLTLGEDGSLTAYSERGSRVWGVSTGSQGAVLTLADNGDLFLAIGAKRLWNFREADSYRSSSLEAFVAWLAPGDVLRRGGQLRSINGQAVADLCPAGLRVTLKRSHVSEIVIRTDHAPEQLAVQHDGTIALLDTANEVLWRYDSSSRGCFVEIDDHGVVGLYSAAGDNILCFSGS